MYSENVGKVWREVEPSAIVNGFKKTGIFNSDLNFPVNSEVLPESIFNPTTLAEYKTWKSQQQQTPVQIRAEDTNAAGPTPSPTTTFEQLLLEKVIKTNYLHKSIHLALNLALVINIIKSIAMSLISKFLI